MGLTSFNRSRRKAAQKAQKPAGQAEASVQPEPKPEPTQAADAPSNEDLIALGKSLGIRQAANMKRETLLARIAEKQEAGNADEA